MTGTSFSTIRGKVGDLKKIVRKHNLRMDRLKIVAKQVRRNVGEWEFFDTCESISMGIMSENPIAKEELGKLNRQLAAKKKNHSEAWSSISKIISFGGDYARERYQETLNLLDKDRETYELMTFITKSCLARC